MPVPEYFCSEFFHSTNIYYALTMHIVLGTVDIAENKIKRQKSNPHRIHMLVKETDSKTNI